MRFKNFTGVPTWAKDFVLGRERVNYRGRKFFYTVLRREFQPDVANIAGFVRYPRFLYLSEDIPQEYREIIARHELREALTYCNLDNSCRKSLEVEVGEVPSVLRAEYLRWRLQFFIRLHQYYTTGNGSGLIDEEQAHEIRGNVIFLEELLSHD